MGAGGCCERTAECFLCRFFSGLRVHCMRVDTFLHGCVFALVLAFGLPFKQPGIQKTGRLCQGWGCRYWVLLALGVGAGEPAGRELDGICPPLLWSCSYRLKEVIEIQGGKHQTPGPFSSSVRAESLARTGEPLTSSFPL